MGGLAVFDRKEVHRVLISAAIFKKAASRQDLEKLVKTYLKKNYKGYNLLEIDINSSFAICERLDGEGESDEQQCNESRKNKLTG
ncbi:hypothetical protein V4C29_23955 [Bacillus cereus]|jgi:hypothetical protein|uniref:hypothetical protein n=1 Tax=Bacillus cereus TaxID=1396 RepID=UPI002FE43ECF|nr:hypothetical protein [Bacillus cereus]